MIIINIFAIITITFFLMHSLPGNPFQEEKILSEQIENNLIEKYELNKPLIVQYKSYLKNISHFDLGMSMKNKELKVSDVIQKHFLVSLELGIESISLSIIIAVFLSIISLHKQNTKIERCINNISILGISIPSFILAGMLQIYAVYIHKKIFIDSLKIPIPKIHLIGNESRSLAVISLALVSTFEIYRLIYAKMKEVNSEEYIEYSKSKGLTNRRIYFVHILKNSISPIISTMVSTITRIITGSFIVETVFLIPGLGKYYVTSIIDRDYTMVLGLTIFYSIIFSILMLLSDYINKKIYPRLNILGDSYD